jgi:hypothetical protein
MRKQIGSLAGVAFFGIHATAMAQALGPFDGNYQVVSSTRVNQTFVQRGGQMGFCPEARPGPLVIAQNRVSYITESGRRLDGTVAPNGQIDIRYADPTSFQPTRVNVTGSVDRSGIVRLRQEGNSCSYDIVWQRRA